MTKARPGHATGGLKKGVFYNGKQLRADFEVDGKGFEWRSDHRRGSEDADPHRWYDAIRIRLPPSYLPPAFCGIMQGLRKR